MTLLERIKATIFGEAPPPRPRIPEDDGDERVRAREAGQWQAADVSTPADDPALDNIAAGGVQPQSKPAEIEEAQNPPRHPTGRLN